MYYPAKIEPDTVGYMVSFRDIPEALTAAETLDEARAMAADALLAAMDFYFEDKRPVPPPSAIEDGEELIALPASAWTKVLLLNEMVKQHVGPIQFSARPNCSPSPHAQEAHILTRDLHNPLISE